MRIKRLELIFFIKKLKKRLELSVKETPDELKRLFDRSIEEFVEKSKTKRKFRRPSFKRSISETKLRSKKLLSIKQNSMSNIFNTE